MCTALLSLSPQKVLDNLIEEVDKEEVEPDKIIVSFICIGCIMRYVDMNHNYNQLDSCTMITHLQSSNYNVGHKSLKHIPSNSFDHRSRPLSIESTADIDTASCQCQFRSTLGFFVPFRATLASSLCATRLVSIITCISISFDSMASFSCFCELLIRQNVWSPQRETCPLIIQLAS